MAGIKTTSADHWFSLCVRERTNWACERCGKIYTPPTRALHASHFIGRGNWATRYNPDNAFCHCYGCHSFFEGNPQAFRDWAIGKLGAGTYESLLLASYEIGFAKRAHKEQRRIAAFYRKELAYMRLLRSQGNQGRIDFADYFEKGVA